MALNPPEIRITTDRIAEDALAPARKERSMMQTPQIVRLERRQCSAHTPDGPCQRKAEATVLFDHAGKRIIVSTHGAATGSCLSHCHDQVAIGDAHDARVNARHSIPDIDATEED